MDLRKMSSLISTTHIPAVPVPTNVLMRPRPFSRQFKDFFQLRIWWSWIDRQHVAWMEVCSGLTDLAGLLYFLDLEIDLKSLGSYRLDLVLFDQDTVLNSRGSSPVEGLAGDEYSRNEIGAFEGLADSTSNGLPMCIPLLAQYAKTRWSSLKKHASAFLMPRSQESGYIPMQAQGDDSDHFQGAGFVTAIPLDPALHWPLLANGVCECDQVQKEDEEIHANVCGRGDALGGVEQYADCNDAPDGREDALQMAHLASLVQSFQITPRGQELTHWYEKAPPKIHIWPWPGLLVPDGNDTDACHGKCCEDNGEGTKDDVQPPCRLIVVELIDPVRGQGEACHIKEGATVKSPFASRSSVWRSSRKQWTAKGMLKWIWQGARRKLSISPCALALLPIFLNSIFADN